MLPKTIVVPVDGSPLAERAVRVAAPLLRELDARGVLLSTPWDHDPRPAQSYLDGVSAFVTDGVLDVVVTDDIPAADAIRREACARVDSLVCMTTHGRGRLRWAAVGSVAEEVIRDSSEPMLLVGPHGEDTWSRPARRVVVCVDGSPSGPVAVAHACEWARALDLEVVLVFACHPLDVEGTAHPEAVFGPLEAIVRNAGLPVETRQLFRGSFIAAALVDFADEPAATLIVMAAHRHSGLARMALGSVTMAVLNTTTCPVLVIPPDAD